MSAPEPDDKPSSSGTAIDLLVARIGAKRLILIVGLACILIVPPIVWVTTKGSADGRKTAGPTPEQAAAAGCQLHTFEYGVTNDPEAGPAYQQEALFGSHPPLPDDGFQTGTRTPGLNYILHSLAHEWLIVKYRSDLSEADRRRLRAFAEKPGQGAIAAVPAGPDQSSGVAAIRWGHGLDCADASPAAVAVLAKFEREVDATLPGEAPVR